MPCRTKEMKTEFLEITTKHVDEKLFYYDFSEAINS